MTVHEIVCIAAITRIFLNGGSPAEILNTGTSYIVQDLRIYIIMCSLYGYESGRVELLRTGMVIVSSQPTYAPNWSSLLMMLL